MNEKSYVKVSDVMTPSVHRIGRTATVADAVTEMRRHGVSSLSVERRDATDEFGVITVTDVAHEVIAKDKAPERVYVYEIMSKPVLTVPSEMNIKYAVRLLVKFNISRAVVVDHDRRPVGLVTLRDMVLRHIPERDDKSDS